MERVARHTRPAETARELVAEEDVGELRIGVRAGALVSTLQLQVVEIDVSQHRHGRGHVDHPRRRARLQHLEQQLCEQEVREMIDSERLLDAVL